MPTAINDWLNSPWRPRKGIHEIMRMTLDVQNGTVQRRNSAICTRTLRTWKTRKYAPRRSPPTSGGDELVPLADHVPALVHQRIPARHLAHPFPEGAAVALLAGLLHQVPVGVLDIVLGGLALVPVPPFVVGEELLGRLRHRAVVALFGDEAALPARLIPIQVF